MERVLPICTASWKSAAPVTDRVDFMNEAPSTDNVLPNSNVPSMLASPSTDKVLANLVAPSTFNSSPAVSLSPKRYPSELVVLNC